MTYYVFLLGSYDSCYVGPFDTQEAADNFVASAVDREIDASVVTKEAYLENVAEFGDIPCYNPLEYALPEGDYLFPGNDDYDGQPDWAKEWEDFGEVYSDDYPLYDGGEY